MFQHNGVSDYVLKLPALRTNIYLKDELGQEVIGESAINFVQVSIHVPEWTHSLFLGTRVHIQRPQRLHPHRPPELP